MGDWTDEFGWYDDLDRQEQEEERKARRAKLLTLPEPTQKPMHPELRKMWEDYFDKCFIEFSEAQPAPVREDWGPGPHEVHSLPSEPAPVQEPEIVQRVKRYAGQTMRTARNPNITARECIELANWLAANTTTPPAQRQWVEIDQIKWDGDKLIAKLKENT